MKNKKGEYEKKTNARNEQKPINYMFTYDSGDEVKLIVNNPSLPKKELILPEKLKIKDIVAPKGNINIEVRSDFIILFLCLDIF